jgi:hypothetical protein
MGIFMPKTVASYLPESMLIKVSPELRLFPDANSPDGFRSASAFGYFFHEYAHYLHNISTLSGIVVFINTIELWRCFRLTLDDTGFSGGSDHLDAKQREHLRTLMSYLATARRVYDPVFQNVLEPASVKITSLKPVLEVTGPNEPLLNMLVCDAEVTDRGDNTEKCRVYIGLLELLESVAWLLERRMFEAISPDVQMSEPPVFPYRVVEAAARYLVPGLNNVGTVACVLAALQSSDAPKALSDVFGIASEALRDGRDPVDVLREKAKEALNQGSSKLEKAFNALEEEFANDGVLAKGIRRIVDTARRAFRHRRIDPFFELQIVEGLKLRPESLLRDAIRHYAPCAVLQERDGPDDEIGRDFLLSFLVADEENGLDPEDGLRIVHSIFDFVGRHGTQYRLARTEDARQGPCPFYTCCNRALRAREPSICSSSPWKAADWPEWDQAKGACWYGTAIRITRPPR